MRHAVVFAPLFVERGVLTLNVWGISSMNLKTFETKPCSRKTFVGTIALAVSTFAYWASSVSVFAAEVEEKEKGLEPLAWQTDLAIWTAVVFVILLVILWLFAFGPIVKALDLRERNELARLAATEKSAADAKDLLRQYQQKLEDSEEEVRKILSDAKTDAQKQADAVVAEARLLAAEERERALRDIQNASDVALQEIAEKSASLATLLAGKIIKEELDPAKHARLVENAIADVAKQ